MKEDIIEYYPNDCIYHKIRFRECGNRWYEPFYDMEGRFHREQNLPTFQSWWPNKYRDQISYHTHGKRHNINNPSVIYFFVNGKIFAKLYCLNDQKYSKLAWQEKIKNI